MKNKLTIEDIRAVIVGAHYIRVPDSTMTICVLYLRNGTIVTGSVQPLVEAIFNEETGRKLAYDKAFSNVWQLEGYLLKELVGYSAPGKPGLLRTVPEPTASEPIEPSIGRVVWYHPPTATTELSPVWPALVCFVHDMRSINLAGFTESGSHFFDTHVTLRQVGDELTDDMVVQGYAEWPVRNS